MTSSRRSSIALFVTLVAAAYLILLWRLDWLLFPLDRDETHFWPTALEFSHSLVPSLQTLHGYRELKTRLLANLVAMSFAPLAWDKYAMPLLYVLWLLRSLEGNGSSELAAISTRQDAPAPTGLAH